MLRGFILLLIFVFSLEAKEIERNTVVVFASGNNKFVLPQVIKRFNNLYPNTKILVEYGASGDLASAILDDVYYDIFLAADMDIPENIYIANKSATPVKKYAQGSLILFIPADKTLSEKRLNILKDEKIKDITIANPKTAPYGKAAVEALKNANLFDSLAGKIKYSTDISTVIQNSIWYDAAGFLSKSGVYSLPSAYKTEGVNWIEIDQSLYTPINQGYVLSKEGLENGHAMKFLNFLLSKEGQDIYKAYGYK